MGKAQLSDASVPCSITGVIQWETVESHSHYPGQGGHMSNTFSGLAKKLHCQAHLPQKSPSNFSSFDFYVAIQNSKRTRQKSLVSFKWLSPEPMYYFSHCYNQICGKKQVGGGRVSFSPLFKRTRCLGRGSSTNRKWLVTCIPTQEAERDEFWVFIHVLLASWLSPGS